MYKIYFKQALEMLKQNKFFSIISILGTALAIMMIMAIIITDEVKNISVVPEINRDQTLYLTFQSIRDTANGRNNTNSGSVEYDIVKNYISLLKSPELISAQRQSNAIISMEGTEDNIPAIVKHVSANYWKMYSFSFIEGKPFNEEEFQSGISNAVISESMAKRVFRGENVIGQTINTNFQPYRVVGIVKDISPIFNHATADMWVPYTSVKYYTERAFDVMLLVKNKNDIKIVREELRKIEQKFHQDELTKTLYLRGPETHRIHKMGLWGENENEMNEFVKIRNRKIGFILIIILLVPAINLSGLNLSRIKKRTPEIGVRKAFGAKRHIILTQILWENLITSFIGGIIGLIFSVLIVFSMRNWLLGIPQDGSIPFNTIFSFPVFLSVFAACLVINLLSAAIPAYRASHLEIVNSLTNNDKVS